jgi:hypothetical protein
MNGIQAITVEAQRAAEYVQWYCVYYLSTCSNADMQSASSSLARDRLVGALDCTAWLLVVQYAAAIRVVGMAVVEAQ